MEAISLKIVGTAHMQRGSGVNTGFLRLSACWGAYFKCQVLLGKGWVGGGGGGGGEGQRVVGSQQPTLHTV